MLKTILVPLDDSILAEQALIYAADLSRRAGASLLLVRAAIAHTLLPASPHAGLPARPWSRSGVPPRRSSTRRAWRAPISSS